MSKTKSVASGNKDKRVRLSVRLLQTEKRRLEKRAEKSDLNLSEYVRILLFGNDGKQQGIEKVNQCVNKCQKILNIVQEKYSCEDNSLLEEKVKELWKLLS